MPAALVQEHGPGEGSHRGSHRWARTAWVFSGICVLVALWFTIGPWSVTIGGGSYSCGSPFMGRYRSVADPAATASAACHLQADGRLHIAMAAWITGLVLLAIALVLSANSKRLSTDPIGSMLTNDAQPPGSA